MLYPSQQTVTPASLVSGGGVVGETYNLQIKHACSSHIYTCRHTHTLTHFKRLQVTYYETTYSIVNVRQTEGSGPLKHNRNFHSFNITTCFILAKVKKKPLAQSGKAKGFQYVASATPECGQRQSQLGPSTAFHLHALF